MRLLASYLKRHIKVMVLLVFFVLIFAAVFSLYDLAVEAVWYAAALCLALGLLLFFLGFYQYWRRNRALQAILDRVAVSIDDLPPPRGAEEANYQAMLKSLFEEKQQIQARAEARYLEMTDYYTLWAHQIKTPIAALRLLLQAREENTELLSELFKVEQYVEMVLQYLRLESESTDYVFQRCDLDSLLRSCLRKYARMFILKKVQLELEETGLQVLTDEKWLAFVIEQILSNALKYTKTGGSIRIYARGQVLVIQDSGIGIRPEDLPRVCEKGFTGGNGRVDKSSTGIGLYLCRRVLKKLGHGLRLESELGRGTRVLIDLTEM